MFIKVDIRYRSKYARKKFAKYRYISNDRFDRALLSTENGYIITTEDGLEIALG